jgi:hypothetical protein
MSLFLPFAIVWFIGFVYYIFILAMLDEQESFGWQLMTVLIIAFWPLTMTFATLIDKDDVFSFSDYLFTALMLMAILYPFIQH